MQILSLPVCTTKSDRSLTTVKSIWLRKKLRLFSFQNRQAHPAAASSASLLGTAVDNRSSRSTVHSGLNSVFHYLGRRIVVIPRSSNPIIHKSRHNLFKAGMSLRNCVNPRIFRNFIQSQHPRQSHSLQAQKLRRQLTSYDKLLDSDDEQNLYLLWEKHPEKEWVYGTKKG